MTASNEWPADIVFWFKDGMCCSYRARAAAGVEISIGLADSMRGLGFIVSRGDTSIDFVLRLGVCRQHFFTVHFLDPQFAFVV